MPDHLLPATISIDELLDTAPGANRGIYHSTKSCGDPQVDEPIDNYSESQVNDAITVVNRATVDGTDVQAAMAASLIRELDKVTSCNAELSFSTLLDLLGWRYDKTGDKSDTMTQVVRSLGVELVLRESPRGFITVKNTEKRVAELLQCIEQILCQVSALFKDARPRKVSAFTNEVCYIFTDASFEPESCEGGIGAVLVSPQGTIASWFSHMLSKEECRPFMRQGQRQCICELEAVTILAAIRMWKHVVAARHTIFFVDNEGSRFAILRGWSQNEILAQISFRVAQEEDLACMYGWYAR
ncbi:unnamed protein product, partial [Effrenium voratum]